MTSFPSSSTSVPIIIDSREQKPYSFNPHLERPVRRALQAGDYSVEGLERTISVTRKILDSFVGTVSRDRDRFYRGLRRLEDYRHDCVVVEDSQVDAFARRYRSHAHPESVFGSAMAIAVDFSVPVFFCSNRQIACRFVEGYLLRAAGKGGPREND